MITLFGQLPAPYVYGAIYSIDERKKTAFNLTMLYSWAGVIFIFITMIIRLRKFKKLENADLLRDSKRPQAGEIRRRSDIMLEFSQQINVNILKINFLFYVLVYKLLISRIKYLYFRMIMSKLTTSIIKLIAI